MSLQFSQRPGRQERHLLRKLDNPLFPTEEQSISEAELQEAQRLDHEELVEFITEFQKLIYTAINLKSNEGSEVILHMKERLDKAYEQASGLADDQSETKTALQKLVQVVMTAVKVGAKGDMHALTELEQEELARAAHFELLEQPIVADILCPDSPISENELLPSLLSETEAGLKASLELFDATQLAVLCEKAHRLLQQVADKGDVPERARQRLQEMETRLTTLASGQAN
jgi:hypothetical protein